MVDIKYSFLIVIKNSNKKQMNVNSSIIHLFNRNTGEESYAQLTEQQMLPIKAG